jgi:hypothetical protein
LVAPKHRLRPYQLRIARAIVDSVRNRRGDTITVLMARQAGKNELSAQLEAFLLYRYAIAGGRIIKAAPTMDPQLDISHDRLARVLRSAQARHLPPGDTPTRRDFAVGRAGLRLLSGAPDANVVGDSATILLEIDEAQDFDEDVFFKDFLPMTTTTNATVVLYGTSLDEDTLLERHRRLNLAREADLGRNLNFEVPWDQVAEYNPDYRKRIQSIIDELGADDPRVRTQFFLECVPGAGRFLPPEFTDALRGDHHRGQDLRDDVRVVAGIDLAGSIVDPANQSRRLIQARDETVVVIGHADRSVQSRYANHPFVEIVEIFRSRAGYAHQMDWLAGIIRRYDVSHVTVDSTGPGRPVASKLRDQFGLRVQPFDFTSKSKSDLGWDLRSALNAGRLKLYKDDDLDSRDLVRQFRSARHELRSSDTLNFYVRPSDGHDDILMAAALLVQAAENVLPPACSALIRGRPLPGEFDDWPYA